MRYLFILIAALVLGAGIFYIYSQNNNKKIPVLLARKGEIGLGSNWENTKRAIEGLQDKIRKNPEDYQSKLMLAYAFMQEARVTGEHPYYYPAAMGMIEDVIDNTKEEDSIHFRAMVAKASVEASLHHFAEALATGKEAMKLNAEDKDLYGVLCDANVELGNYPEAIKMADKMVSLRPELQSYSRISYLREIHGDMPGAIKAMEMAVQAGYPGLEQTSWTRYNLGKLYARQGDTAKARMAFEQTIAEDPRYAFAYGGLASLAHERGDNARALALYEKALNIIPEFSFQEEIAHIYTHTGDKRAKEALDKTIEMLAEDKEAGHDVDLELANLFLEVGKDTDRALKYAKAEYERRPNNIDVNRSLAMIYHARGEKEECKKYATVALRTKKKDAELEALIKS